MLSLPALDEVEITFFGPGYGECILIHATQNEWLIVDSCIDPHRKIPPALDYLQKIGVDPSQAVKLVVASHWHDDHIRGLATIFETCSNAEFALSGALTSEEFMAAASAFGKGSMMAGSSGLVELHRILSHLLEAKKTGNRSFKPPIWATADRCIYVGDGKRCKVYALSPSDWAVTEAKREIATLLPTMNEPKKWLVPGVPSANHIAVVLWIEIDGDSILLGSDLEEEGSEHTGWSAIVRSDKRPDGKAVLFKIPHHGSVTAHLPEVWTHLLEKNPVSVCTPYNKGKGLPTLEDVSRICQNTTEAFTTSTQRVIEQKKDPVAEKMISEMGVKIKRRPYRPGIVRVRFKQADAANYSVELFDGAARLK